MAFGAETNERSGIQRIRIVEINLRHPGRHIYPLTLHFGSEGQPRVDSNQLGMFWKFHVEHIWSCAAVHICFTQFTNGAHATEAT